MRDVTADWYLFPELLPASVNLASYSTAQDLLDAMTATARARCCGSVRWTIGTARRGWVTAANVVNTRSLDEMLALLKSLCERRGLTRLMACHDLRDAERLLEAVA